MTITKIALLTASAGLLGLTACTDPVTGDPNRTRSGALTGAAIGAVLGGTRESGSDRLKNAALGAAIGAAGGAVIGNVLDKQAAELRGDFSNGSIDVVNNGNELIVRMPQDILFATDSASVSGGLRGDLGVLAANLNRYPNSVVEVQGHTDNTGASAYNLDLSQRRAQAVTAILASNGVSSSRLRAIGYGEDRPVASNLSASTRAQNRRVDIVIRPTN
ncbi:OmpA family protein [Oceaniovalibus sp. ACAM 378]|jgi:outer membrane protein OmpA-like peptidoglycan-associated protein|uniref:OmpA family protein n=1 Tax=Oceaniovalibus sp. ACAM 378 TaxID=2599923 RepID=UPI0011D69DB3|nr:OmpA family protein [Oceaniovalibus sp. ACAM 378]TYB90631.1 OmpA family protein [Oceaniovalibus sp. ACAM 378]